jgi:PAS domain S-box-containing protein
MESETQNSKLNVLLIEDNPGDARLIREMLAEIRGAQFDLECADRLSIGLERLAAGGIDVALLDLSLPDAQGMDTFVKAYRQAPGVPIVVLTGLDDETLAVQAVQRGAQDYLVKGQVNTDLLVRAMRYAIERKRAEVKLGEMLAQIEKSRDDMLSILNQLRLGTAITDKDGCITFLSQACQRFLGKNGEEFLGRHWEELWSFEEPDKAQLQAMCDRPAGLRTKVPVRMQAPGGQHYWMEIEVQDDPRDLKRKIFFFYDMSEVYDLRRLLDEKAQFLNLVGKSKPMNLVFQQIRELSQVDSTVLIEGETGTGKELVAQAIHFSGYRKNKPFIAVNSAGLTDSLLASQLFGHRRGAFTGAIEDYQGLIQAANGGTLFLDEIGDIPMNVQISLLRVLQEKEITPLGESKSRKVDVRVLAATHHNLSEEVAKGRFRLDLLYRIRVARIQLPPLRERREDIPLLVGSFLGQCRAATGKPVHDVSNEAVWMLMQYTWPGNVRELKSALEFAVIRCKGSVIHADDLPPEILTSAYPQQLPGATHQDEKNRLLVALEHVKGNRAAAARLLGISRATLYRRLASLGIETSK